MSTRRRRVFTLLAALLATPIVGHGATVQCTKMTPPAVTIGKTEPTQAADDAMRRDLGRAYARRRGAIREVRLLGSPETIGEAQVRLNREAMTRIETKMNDQFAYFVPWRAGRMVLVDMARLRFRDLDGAMSKRKLRELAAGAQAFQPDPFEDMMETYQRFVFLHSLYDIMLSFERSPLVGCTSFVLTGKASGDGHVVVGRNFDFEGPQILDDEKAVFLVHEEGRIPYASVSWPGFIGASTGMNAQGLAIVVHGARAGEPQVNGGEPVSHTIRALLAENTDVASALVDLGKRDTMVSHMLLLADPSGAAVVVERIPGQPIHVRRRDTPTLPLTNHLEGPGSKDPKNAEVRAQSSTLARRARLDELLSKNSPGGSSVQRAVRMLRDKRAAGNQELPLGHREAIDALIATHSVVMDTTARAIWVSEGPHAMGRYVKFPLKTLLDPAYEPKGPPRVESLPADDIVRSGRYDAWVKSGREHRGRE